MMPHRHGTDNCSQIFSRKGRHFGSWGEQISDSDFPAESAARIPSIVGVCVHIWSGADGDDGEGDDGDGDGDDDSDGDGVGDGNYSTRST